MACARASGLNLYSYGSVSSAEGLTGISTAEGFDATVLNPAMLAKQKHNHFGIGLHVRDVNISLSGQSASIDSGLANTLGMTIPLPFGGILKERLVFGMAFYAPVSSVFGGNVRFPEEAAFPVIERGGGLSGHLSLGISLDDVVNGLSIGIGTAFIADLSGELVVIEDSVGDVSSVSDFDVPVVFSPLVGVSYAPQPSSWGAALLYRQAVGSQLSMTVDPGSIVPVELPLIQIGGAGDYDPTSISAEGYAWPHSDIRITAQLLYRRYSDHPQLAVSGSIDSSQTPSLNYKDTWTPRLGVRYVLPWFERRTQLRVGYAYDASPAPNARNVDLLAQDGTLSGRQTAFRVFDNDRHVLTAGAHMDFELGGGFDRLVLDTYVQLHLLSEREHDVSAWQDGPLANTSGSIFAAGLSAEVVW